MQKQGAPLGAPYLGYHALLGLGPGSQPYGKVVYQCDHNGSVKVTHVVALPCLASEHTRK